VSAEADGARRAVWLDTDPGFDDWMAWALLEADPGVDLLGVGVVAGNAPLRATLDNALRIRALHGWTTPVHAGCDRPLVQTPVTAQDVLGPQAMATVGRILPALPASPVQGPAHGHAVQALIDAVRARPGRVTLLAIGPLTNVATAFALAPDLPALLQGLVLMGGSTDRGNATAAAEFNIHADPEAAARVFSSGIEPVMFGLNVCRQVQVGPAEVGALRALDTERAAIFADHLDAYVGIARRRGGSTMAVYDPTPVAWLARPEAFQLELARVDVELDGRHTRGMTVCEFRVPARAAPNARVATAADGAAVMAWMLSTLPAVLGG
jgi:purine nucleosidase